MYKKLSLLVCGYLEGLSWTFWEQFGVNKLTNPKIRLE